MKEELNKLKALWSSPDVKKISASIELVHMIEANIYQFELITNWIIQQKQSAIESRTPYFVPTNPEEHPAFGAEMQRWRSTTVSISTLLFALFMTSRSTTDNLYRLFLEITQPKSKWGRFTSIKDGFKKEEFKNLFLDIDTFQNDFNRMRWIRNCYKAGAYCSSGGIEKNGELFIHLLMPEKDKTVVNIDSRITENDMTKAISLCTETLKVLIKRSQ